MMIHATADTAPTTIPTISPVDNFLSFLVSCKLESRSIMIIEPEK